MLELDIELLGMYLGGWDDKDGRAARYSSGGHNYRTWKPTAASTSDGGIHVIAKLDHIKGGKKDDHASIILYYDHQGKIVKAQSSIQSGGKVYNAEALQARVSEVFPVIGDAAAFGIEIADQLYTALTGESGGLLHFPAVIQDNVVRISSCILPIPRWRRWYPLGGILKSAPAACSWEAGRLDVFCVGADTDRNLFHMCWENQWTQWNSIGPGPNNNTITTLSAVSWAQDQIDIFARINPLGTSGAYTPYLAQKRWNGSGWTNWKSGIGNSMPAIADGPTVSSWGEGRLDVFAKNYSDNLIHTWYENGKWHAWEEFEGRIKGGPCAVSWGNNRIDVFARGYDDTLLHKWFAGKWYEWESLGGRLSSGPAAASWDEGRLDIFWRGMDGTLEHLWFWKNWGYIESLGGIITSKPSAVSWGPNRIDVFARDSNYSMHHLCFG